MKGSILSQWHGIYLHTVGWLMLTLALMTGSSHAQSVSVVDWNFTSATTPFNASTVNFAVTTSPVTLTKDSTLTLTRNSSAPIYTTSGSWAGTEDSGFIGTRTSLTARSAKSLSTNFTLTSQASGNWSNLTLSMAYQRPSTAPNKARAVLTWQQAGVFKRAYTSALSLSGSSWTTLSATFSSGDTLPTTLASLPCLLEVYFWGTSTTPNSINVDDLKLLCDSLSNVYATTPTTLAAWPQNKSYWAQFGVTGYASTITWSASGTLPPGLTFDTVNGRLTGTPTTQGTYSFSVTATGTGLSQTANHSLTISAPPSTPPAVPALVKWTWDSDSSATTLSTLPAGDVNAALTEVSYGYQGSSTMTGSLHAGGSSFTSSTPINAAGAGQARSFSGWETSSSYATTRNGLLHLNSGLTPRFAVYPGGNTASIPLLSQTSTGEGGVLQSRLKFNANSIGDVKALYFDALRWQSGRMDISGSNGPRWAELHAYWLNDSGVMQRWDSSLVDITAVYRPENRGANQFTRYWFDLDNGSSGLNQRIKATTQRYRSNRQVFFDLYFYHDTGADVSGLSGSNPPSILVDEMAVLGSMVSTTPLVSVGNAVFNDTNYNGDYDAGEGVAGVSVQLLNTGGTVLQTTTTGTGGAYLFSGLAEGSYVIKIPASEFAVGEPLNGLVSITGNGTDNGVDDGSDENGIDNAAPATNGIASSTITLYANSEPTTSETGFNGASDDETDATDEASDLTVDFGFQSKPPFIVGDRVFIDSNANNLYEPSEGRDGVTVELLNSSNVVLATQTTANGGRYLFTGLSNANSYYVRVAASNFSGAGVLTGYSTVPGSSTDNGVDHDDNGVDDAATTTNGIKSTLITPDATQGGIFSHTWPASSSATVNASGGTWEQVFLSHNYNTKMMDVSVTLDTATQNTQALWMVITNGTSSSSINSNLAALYVANGQVKVTPYEALGTTSHTLGTTIYSTTYTTTNVGTKRTFRFTLDTNAINQWTSAPASWQGTGFPYDAQGSQPDFTAKKIGLRLRSFADGAATLSGSTWTVTYGGSGDTNVGSFDQTAALSDLGADNGIDFGFYVTPTYDNGDFNGFAAASSTLTNGLRIGALIDADSTNTANTAATGDDTTGSDDEDGVTLPGSLVAGAGDTITVSVTNTTGATVYLNGWIDFNNNGVLTDSGEQITTNQAIATGASNSPQQVTVIVPTTVVAGQAGARFRLTTVQNPGPTGTSGAGEVEDYLVTLATPFTPSNILWLTTYTGSQGRLETYNISTGAKVNIGATSDSTNHYFFDLAWSPTGKLYGIEPASGNKTNVYEINPSTAATTFRGSVTNLFNGMVFDQTGTVYISSYNVSDVYAFSISSLSTSSTLTPTRIFDLPTNTPDGGTLQSGGDVAWVGQELYYATYSSNNRFYLYKGAAGSGVMTVVGEFKDTGGASISNVFGLITDGYGSIYAQAGTSLYKLNRTTAVASSQSSGISSNAISGGAITSESSQVNDDYGDYNGIALARSRVNNNLRMGTLIDGEAPPGNNAAATNDDTTGVDDDDGVALPTNVTPGISSSLTVTVTNATAASAYLNVWIDLNKNGLLTDLGDQVGTSLLVAAGTSNSVRTINFTVPVTTLSGPLAVRARLTAEASPGPSGGSAGDGEIEDYLLTLAAPTQDFGDNSALAEASSTLDTRMRMGALVDAEFPATNDVTATGDDTTGTDDEDGVTIPATLPPGAATSITVNVTNTIGSTAQLNAWIDYNNNGSLADSGEQIVSQQSVSSGTSNSNVTLNFTVPANASAGLRALRVRLTSNGNPGPTGSGGTGEVEDYRVTIPCPTISITPSTLANATAGTTYTQATAFSASGGASPFTYYASGVPTGMTYDSSSNRLTGAPTSSGTYSITITVVDANGCSGSSSVPLTVNTAAVLSIGNLVWNDINSNGLKDAAEGGINNVLVELWSPGSDNAIGGSGTATDTKLASTNTSNGGLYTFASLTAGRYFIKVPTVPFSRVSAVVDTTDNGEDNDNNASQPGGPGTAAFSPVIQLATNSEPGNDGSTNIDNTIDLGFVSNLGSPFACDNRFYIMQAVERSAGTDVWDSTLYYIDAGPSLTPVFIFSGKKLNGLAAYGGFLYCVDQNGNHLYRINALGELVDMGAVPGLPSPGTDGQWSGATALTNGQMILNLYSFSPIKTTLYTINLATASLVGSGVTCVNTGTGINYAGNFGDIAWDPITGKIYGYGTTDALWLGLFEIDLGSGYCTRVAANTVASYGSLVIDANGLTYGYGSASIGVVQDTLWLLTRSGNTLTGAMTNVGTGPTVSNSDGAACPGAAPTMKIGNLVWNDANNNGTKDASESGIDGVPMQLFYGGQNPLTATPVATATTAGGGLYSFNNLSPGQYFVYMPSPPGATPLSSTITVTTDNQVDNDDNGSQSTLAGQPVTSPLIALTAGSESITDGDTDANSELTIDFGLRACPTISLTPTTLANGTAGNAYTQAAAFSASGGVSPYTYTASGVPAGMSFDATNKRLIGTPTTNGTFNVTITATDATNCASSVAVSFVVGCPTITLTPTTLPSATVGSAYTQVTAFSASGGSGSYTYSASNLPVGMSFDATNKKLIGTPTSAGTSNVTITATDTSSCTGSVIIAFTRVCPTISVTPTTLSSAIVGSAYAQATAFSAGGGSGSYTFSASNVPAGMSLDATNKKLIGTPTSAGTTNVTITATDANSCAGSVVIAFTSVCPTVSVTPTTLPSATVGQAYTQATAFSASGGSGSYTFSASGVPVGMSFDAINKKLTGTPTSAGTSNVTITATDANGCPGSAVISFTRVCPAVTVTPTTLPNATVGSAYTQATAFSASGGSGNYLFAAIGMPAGMSFDATNKKLTGTPTSAGTGSVTVSATDENGCSGSVVITFTRVCPTISVTPPTLSNATIGQAYTQATAFSASGGTAAYTFSASNVPAGMSFDSTSKKLIGTPTALGTTNVTVTATDANSCAGSVVIAFTVVCPTITVTPLTLSNATIGVAYTQATAFSASGSTTAYTFSASNLPAGMSFDATNKKLIGTPTVLGTTNVTITATDTNTCTGTVVIAFSVVCPTITLTPTTLADATVGQAYTQATAFSASGSTTAYTYSASGVPVGMSFDATNKKLIGTPTVPGTSNVTFTATDTNNCSGSVVISFSRVCPTITVTPTTLLNATIGQAYTQVTAFSASGGTAGYTFSASNLPAGMSFDATNKKLIGTPTVLGTTNVTITATDANTCTGIVVIPFTVVCPTISLIPSTLSNATIDQAYTQAMAFSASGSTTAYTFSASNLPAGMSFDATNKKLIGTPTALGTTNVTVTATDANTCIGTVVIPFTVVCPTITVTPTMLANATVGQAYTQVTAFSASGGSGAYTFSASGVPAGMSFDATSKKVTGSPTTFGTANLIVTATDANNCSGSVNVSFTVVCPTLSISPTTLPNATVGSAYTQATAFSGSGGSAPYSFNASNLPAGMSFDTTNKKLTGTPTSAGTSIVTIIVTDASSCTGSLDIAFTRVCPTITVTPATLANAMVGSIYTQATAFSASGGTAAYTFSASGVPAGMSFNATSKKLTGTPTTDGTFNVTITATDANACTGSVIVPLTVDPPANLAIGNLVWEDFNNDGLKQASESGLQNASVRLYRSGADNAVNTADDTLVSGPFITGSSGAYTFTGLTVGSYYVRVTPPANNFRTGGTPVTLDNDVDGDNNGSQPGGVGASCYSPIIALTANGETIDEDDDANTNLTVDFGMWGGFTVGNIVWHDANNNGLKDSGEVLLPAVTVQLMSPGADLAVGGTDDAVLLTTSTNAMGVYNFFVPQTGKFFVRLNPNSGYELPSTVVFGDTGVDNDNNGSQPGGVSSFVNSMVFDLLATTEPGNTGTTNVETTIDFGLWGGLSAGGYVWKDANNNGLIDPSGAPSTSPELGIQSQALSLYSTGADHAVGGSGGNADTLVATTVSLSDGSYAFTKLQPGYYYIRITPGTTYPLASAVVDLADNGELNDNNGAQPGGISTDITSPVFQLDALTEPGSAGATSNDNSLWFGLRERPEIVISPPTLAGGQVGLPYTQTVVASGGTGPYVWSVTGGTLPQGLTLNPSTGEISGLPIMAGTALFTLQAQDAQMVKATRNYSVTIYEIEISPPTLPVGYVGQSFSQVLVASGGTAPYVWSISSGALPPGVSLSLASGQLAGKPTATGTYTFTVRVIDGNGFYGTRPYTLTVLGTLSLGNLIFEDQNGNSHYDAGEGIDGVTVQLYRSSQTPGTDTPVDTLVTANGGKYVFTDVVPGTYKVHVPASHFGTSGLLRGLFSLPGTQAGDDDVGEDGVDGFSPQTTGISSVLVTLDFNACPTDATGETGFDHESDNASEVGDASVDLTLDLGFYRRVGVGNLVFSDGNGNGVADNGEGVGGVLVELYRNTQTPGVDTPVATATTNSSGLYLIANQQPGLYRVHIPKAMFQPGAPLEAKLSIDQGFFGDDDVGEDGLNTTDPLTEGVSSNEIFLQASLAPTNQNGETGMDNTSDDDIDAAVDLTVDFGFQSPAMVGNLVFIDANHNGHYDTGEGVDGVDLDLYTSGSLVGSTPALQSVTTADGGHYLFGNLAGGSYFVNVRASNFGLQKPLEGKVSILGAAVAGSDDSVGEDGLDNSSPGINGISTADFLVQAGSMPVDSAVGAATGENGFQPDDDNGNGQDANGNMTIDLGFEPVDSTKLAVGNLVFSDTDGDNRFDEGEGLDGVLVELHSAATNLLLASTYTGSGGLYYFSNLSAGDYYIVIAASNFQGTGKLVGKVPMAGQGGDNGMDDDADENGDNLGDHATAGVRSTDFTLAAGTEPTDDDTELGAATYLDNSIDSNSDLTIDFGFYTPGGLGNVVFVDTNQNGKADAGEGVGNVTVRLFADGADPLLDSSLAEVQTDSTVGHEGAFMFTNLPPGDYFLHVPGTMFDQGAPLFGKVSLTGVESVQKDDNLGENGIDAESTTLQGVRTATTQLRPGAEPFGSGEAGLYGGDDTALGDKLYDLTQDFGFVTNPTVGNLVFRDVNRDGLYTDGVDVGIDGVTVELYTAGANAGLVATTQTFSGGRYFFSVSAGTYVIKVPAAMFATGQPLANLQASLTAAGDDDAGQDAIDSTTRSTTGVQTAPFTLALGTMPTAATGETGHAASTDDLNDGDTNLTVDLGFKSLPLGVGNLVFKDANNNGKFDTGDTGVAGVTVKLFFFGDDPLTATPVATTQTGANGYYLLEAYVEDNYIVHVDKQNFATGGALAGLTSSTGAVSGTGDDQVDENGIDAAVPATSGISTNLISLIYGAQPVDSETELGQNAISDNVADENTDLTVDFGFYMPAGAPLAGRVRRDLNNDGKASSADAPLPSVQVTLYDDSNANGTLDTVEMSAVDTTTSDDTGSYLFNDVNAGNYLVVASPLPGAVAESDTDGGVPDQTQVTVAAAPVTGIDFLQSLSADTFALWQQQHTLAGQNGAGDNPDADATSNLLEYALGSDPESGVTALPGFELVATAGIDAMVRRPVSGHADLHYKLQGSVDGAAWSDLTAIPAVSLSEGVETLRYTDLADEALFAGQSLGYVRLHVVLDADQDGTSEAEASSIVSAFTQQALPVGQTTLSMPLLASEVYAGEASVAGARQLSISQGAGLMAALQAGQSYEVQVLAGAHAGERYELDLATSTDRTLVTRSDLPASFSSARIAVRPVQTLARLLPTALFSESTSSSTADRVLFFEAGAYRVHWLAAAPSGARWVADASLADTGSRRLAPREGFLVQVREAPVTLPLVGQVPVAASAISVASGTRLVGSGSLSAINPIATAGDRLRAWSGDDAPGTSTFIDHTYSATGWTRAATGQPSGTPPLLNPFRAVFTVKVP